MRRAILSIVVALGLLVGPRLHAAVNMLASNTARVSFGDIAAIAAGNDLSVAVTVTLSANSATGDFVVHQWPTAGNPPAFLIDVIDTDELRYLTHTGASAVSCYYGKKTNSLNLTNGSTYRIVARMRDFDDAGNRTLNIWVNGASQALTDTHNPGLCAITITDVSVPVEVGYNSTRSDDGLDADYSEVAIWGTYIPDWVAAAYGKGMSPAFYRTGGILYAPLTNTDGLRDVWGGILGTNSSGTSAAHPSMYYPSGGQ
jgi:hypothetical protein